MNKACSTLLHFQTFAVSINEDKKVNLEHKIPRIFVMAQNTAAGSHIYFNSQFCAHFGHDVGKSFIPLYNRLTKIYV